MTIKETYLPKYLCSALYAPAYIPVTDDKFDWETTDESRWYYGNIGSSTKVLTLSRVGGPITMLQWQLKRFNCHLGSYTSCAEGSLRMVCDTCNKFQCLTPKKEPHLALQGCSMCLLKLPLVDVALLVSNFKELLIYGLIQSITYFQGPYGAYGTFSCKLSFCLGVETRYRFRIPALADSLHTILPNMFPSTLSMSRPDSAIYFLGKSYIYNSHLISYLAQRTLKSLNSPDLFATLVLDTSTEEGLNFVMSLKVKF